MPLPGGSDGAVQQVYDVIAQALITGLQMIGVHAAIARNDGPRGPVCFAGQQGADLRVANQKVCGSAQARQRGAVLQHGSLLMRRLPIDESDLTRGSCDRAALRNATVTLEELGAPCDPRRVGEAIVAGFAQAMCLAFAPPALSAQGAHSIVDGASSASVPL
jgi:lipoate-protein ligase A